MVLGIGHNVAVKVEVERANGSNLACGDELASLVVASLVGVLLSDDPVVESVISFASGGKSEAKPLTK